MAHEPTPEWEDTSKWGKEMHVQDHLETFGHFWTLSKWTLIIVAVVLALMAAFLT
mgnify:CR=1 FL=1